MTRFTIVARESPQNVHTTTKLDIYFSINKIQVYKNYRITNYNYTFNSKNMSLL